MSNIISPPASRSRSDANGRQRDRDEKHDKTIIRFARGGARNLGKADNKVTSWESLKSLLGNCRYTNEKVTEYDKLHPDEQAPLKRINGFIYGAATKDGRRKRGHGLPRRVISLDLDKIKTETFEQIKAGVHPVCQFEHFVHTTRSDRARQRRIRIFILTEDLISEQDYEAHARIFVRVFFGEDGFEEVDIVSYRPNQLMYRATASSNQMFESWENRGEMLHARRVCEEWGEELYGDTGAWMNYALLPRGPNEQTFRQSQVKAQNPREKTGLVGAFCRAYTVEEAISTFIPDVYSPVDQGWGGKSRYTYNYGHASAGVEVQDDGLFIYSHHGTDPCGDRLVNAFDMVRIHMFGDRDDDIPDENAPDAPKINKRPSYEAMREFVRQDEGTLLEYSGDDAVDRQAVDAEDAFGDDDIDPQATSDAPLAKPPVLQAGRRSWAELDQDERDIIGEPKPPTMLDKMNARHAVAMIGGAAVIINTDGSEVTYSSRADLILRYQNRKMPNAKGGEYTLAEWWLEQPGRLFYPRGVVFVPGKTVKGAYNLFRGWKVQLKKGDCPLILDHMYKIICKGDSALFNWLMGYLSHMFQRPWEKPGVALVFKGLKGTGKDTVVEYLAKIIGKHRIKIAQPDQLTGRFNRHLQHAFLVHVEEAFFAGDPKAQGPLKSLITSETVRIEPKGVDSFDIPSVFRVVMTSNEDWVVPTTGDERRFAIFNISPALAKLVRGDAQGLAEYRAYFEALYRERDEGGAEALLDMLLTWDMTGVDVRYPPNTVGLAEQNEHSLKGVERWWHHILEVGYLPMPDDVSIGIDEDQDWEHNSLTIQLEPLFRHYEDWNRTHRFEGKALGIANFGAKLKEMSDGWIERVSIDLEPGPDGKRKKGWRHKFAKLPTLRKAFVRYANVPHSWDDVEEDDFGGLI